MWRWIRDEPDTEGTHYPDETGKLLVPFKHQGEFVSHDTAASPDLFHWLNQGFRLPFQALCCRIYMENIDFFLKSPAMSFVTSAFGYTGSTQKQKNQDRGTNFKIILKWGHIKNLSLSQALVHWDSKSTGKLTGFLCQLKLCPCCRVSDRTWTSFCTCWQLLIVHESRLPEMASKSRWNGAKTQCSVWTKDVRTGITSTWITFTALEIFISSAWGKKFS